LLITSTLIFQNPIPTIKKTLQHTTYQPFHQKTKPGKYSPNLAKLTLYRTFGKPSIQSIMALCSTCNSSPCAITVANPSDLNTTFPVCNDAAAAHRRRRLVHYLQRQELARNKNRQYITTRQRNEQLIRGAHRASNGTAGSGCQAGVLQSQYGSCTDAPRAAAAMISPLSERHGADLFVGMTLTGYEVVRLHGGWPRPAPRSSGRGRERNLF
jgi:hypothetical protein